MEHKGLQSSVLAAINTPRSAGLKMTAMIDVVFLLLLFFLVSAQWKPPQSFLPLLLPHARAATAHIALPQPLVITIRHQSAGCCVEVAQKSISIGTDEDFAGLLEMIRQTLEEQKRFAQDPVELLFEPDVRWEYVAKIYNLLYGTGMTDITFGQNEEHD
ncbi:MAG: biopolymer transporter ExbD [Phycisphaerae bacterium]|nr:biopolymer transporter ExbD [Phycisphaerae bacterium]